MKPVIYRTLILDGHKKGLKAIEIHRGLVEVYNQGAPSLGTVEYWVKKAKWGVDDPADTPRPGRPISARNQNLIDKIAKAVGGNRRISISTLASDFGVSDTTVFRVLHDDLGLKKKFAKWIPYKISDAQKAARVEICRSFLKKFSGDSNAIKTRLVTSDETWVMIDNPESRESSREWCKPDERPAQRPRLKPQSEKVMVTVWWDAKGAILVDFWKKSDDVKFNSEYYVEQIKELRKVLPSKRRGLLSAGPLIWIDNSPVHMASNSRAALEQSGFELIKMPPYSPDIAPCDYFLFRNLKTWLRGRKFSSREDLEQQILDWFSSKTSEYYENGISQLMHRMKRVIEAKGEYID